MIVHSKSDVFLGAIVTLNTGDKAEVIDDHENHETVIVNLNNVPTPVLVSEAFNPETDPLWIAEIKPEDNKPQEDEPQPTPACDLFDEIFDGIDPDTFDGDILDLI